MIKPLPACIVILTVALLPSISPAQDSTPPLTAADKEAAYTAAIQARTDDIVKPLAITDSAKAKRISDLIMAQYRALRARDEVIDAKVKPLGGDPAVVDAARAKLFAEQSKPLHDQFLAKLAADLTPEQVEGVKDKMTYGKVKVTYDAYCSIFPSLTDAEKAEIMKQLKAAREEAIDGGSSSQKTRIFQKYKEQINAYLSAHGHDVAKAYAEWNAKQEAAAKEKETPAPKPESSSK